MATALQPVEVSCPVCGGGMYDNRATKKNPKQPDFKCKRYKEGCEGVIWPPKFQKTGTVKSTSVVAATSNVPNQQLPALLQNQEAEDAAELQSKISPPEKPKLTKLYLEATEFFLEKVVPLFEAKEIGLSDTAVVAGIATLFIAASKER